MKRLSGKVRTDGDALCNGENDEMWGRDKGSLYDTSMLEDRVMNFMNVAAVCYASGPKFVGFHQARSS